MMRSKEFYEGSISCLQKMVKHGIYVLLFDVFCRSGSDSFYLCWQMGCNAFGSVNRRIFCGWI